MTFQRETLTVNGVKVVMFTAGAGEPLLFFHGAGTFTGFDWALPWASSFRVLIPYHPGWGESGDAPEMTTVGDYMLHYMDLLDQLGLEKVNLAGLSMGGRFAATFAIQYGHRVRKLVLIAPAGLDVPGYPIMDFSNVPVEDLPKYLVTDFSVIARHVPKGPDPAYEANRDRERASSMRMFQSGLIGPWLPRWLHRVKMPVLIVWGEKDKILPVQQADAWKKLIPQAQLLRVPEVGHLPVEEAPATVGAIADFLR